jgi:hypothetical protein
LKVPDVLRRLGDQLTEIDVDWRHPSWWAAVGAYLALEYVPFADRSDHERVHEYLSANGTPRADNFMGTESDPPTDLAEAIATAVIRARAAADMVAALDGTLPDQPLSRTLAWEDGWLMRTSVDDIRRVAFVTARGAFSAHVDRDGASDGAIASALGSVIADGPGIRPPAVLTAIDPTAEAPTPAAIAVAIGTHPLPICSHIHRRAWTRGGGPWMGVGDAPPLEVVTTCHVVVDGYGHALLTDGVLTRCRARASDVRGLATAAQLGIGAAHRPITPVTSMVAAEPVGLARCFLGEGVGRFAEQAYAFGRAIERRHSDGLPTHGRRATPTFQVPVAPGRADDPERRRNRVVHGLMSVRRRDGDFESLDEFAARIPAFLVREMSESGLVTTLQRNAASLPLPRSWRFRLLQSRHESSRYLKPYAAITGRGRMSSMRFPADERPSAPLYAVSSPTVIATPADPLGAVVLTMIHHDAGCTVTSSTTGQDGDRGAQRFLDEWLEELDRLSSPERIAAANSAT